MTSQIHAIIVGINDYSPKHGALSSAVKDANSFNTALQQVSKAGTKLVLTDDKAKKEGIMEAIKTIAMDAQRNDGFVFFFSGYAAQTTEAGIICPHDIDTVGGISDAELLQMFDDVSRLRGNNITLFFDCPASNFTWKKPSSCVIVAPNEAKETKEGGAFTNAIIKVLTDPRLMPLHSMTVQTFTKYVQAASALTDIEVHCFGSNIDRPLFNLRADRGHFALIPGRNSKDGEILLLAGIAHAVRLGARYGIYNSNVSGYMVRVGELYVDALCDDDITAVLHGESDVETKVLPFFFAVEEQAYFDPVTISMENSTTLQGLLGWKPPNDGQTEKANMTVEHKGNEISLQWNGLDDGPCQGTSSIRSFADNDRPSIQRVVVRAARFRAQLMAPSPEYASFSERLKVKFQEVNAATKKPIGENLLKHDFGNALVKLDFKPQMRIPLCCTIVNDNPFPVWPYIFFYDPDEFTILFWYLPHSGLEPLALGAGQELQVGHGDNNGPCISLRHQANKDSVLTYVKVFVTKEKTDFNFFPQPIFSSLTDKLRCTKEPKEGMESPLPICSGRNEVNEGGSVGRDDHNWASMRITIMQSFKE